MSGPHANPFDRIKVALKDAHYYDLEALHDARFESLPISIRVLLEGCIRNCDEFLVSSKDVETVLNWKDTQAKVEIPFTPARVLMQDFTGVPAVVDLAAMRDCVKRLVGTVAPADVAATAAKNINPLVPVDLVIDHSVQVDASRTAEALEHNEQKEFQRNQERFQFLKWGSSAFENLRIIPPGNGIVHQVNLEYLARVVFHRNGLLYPDTLVGTDSHTTMVNGLGCLGWGVGGIEAEAAMLGQPSSMLLPEVVGFELTKALPAGATATDAVLTITAQLRKFGVVGKFVEFYGAGVHSLSLADRATISNMAPEYGATCGFFPVDTVTLAYLKQTGRTDEHVNLVKDYLSAVGMFVDFSSASGAGATTKTVDTSKIHYTSKLSLDLSTVVPCIAGPKRPHDYVAVSTQKKDFETCLCAPNNGFKGFGLVTAPTTEVPQKSTILNFEGKDYTISHGSVVIAAITSCTNTSNPNVLIAAGLVAKKAKDLGLTIPKYIKTSLSPGSKVVEQYLQQSGLLSSLQDQGFFIAGYGCMTCIGNSGELYPGVGEAFVSNKIVAASVLSGNRNFEARVHPDTAANYLASPPLVVAYALAGTMNIDLQNDAIGVSSTGAKVYLKDIWPSHEEVAAVVQKYVTAEIFSSVYQRIQQGNARWDALKVSSGDAASAAHYHWDEQSTYIHNPPFFSSMALALPSAGGPAGITGARCLLFVGDSITTDHISPAGDINAKSPAAAFLVSKGVTKVDFNTYGARRGNDLVMARGTFANTRLHNKVVAAAATTPAATPSGPISVHLPTGTVQSIFDVSATYQASHVPLCIVAGKEYGSGSSRDWAAKGPYLLGVKVVLAESFERIHRANLVGMGIVPMCFEAGQTAESLGITGTEVFEFGLVEPVKAGQRIAVKATSRPTAEGGAATATTKEFHATLRLDTEAEIAYYRNGGILHYVLRQKVSAAVPKSA